MSPYHDHDVLVQQSSPIVHLALILHSSQLFGKIHGLVKESQELLQVA
jgi:hypothetical protein